METLAFFLEADPGVGCISRLMDWLDIVDKGVSVAVALREGLEIIAVSKLDGAILSLLLGVSIRDTNDIQRADRVV